MSSETLTEKLERRAELFRTDDGFVRLRSQPEAPKSPVILFVGNGNEALAYGLNATEIQALADVFTEIASLL